MKKTFFQKMFVHKKISMMMFLGIFFLCSSAFASGDNYLNGKPTEKKDISVFVSVLGERLQGVFEDLISFSFDDTSFVLSSGTKEKDNIFLTDCRDHIYRSEILSLYDLGVIDGSREKFYPDNYLRRYELAIMIVKYRLAKLNKQLSPIVFPMYGWFFDVAQNSSYAPYVAYAEQNGWIDSLIENKDEKKIFLPNKFLLKKEICNILSLDKTHLFCNNEKIKRGEFAAVLFRGFSELDKDKSLDEDSFGNNKLNNNQKMINQFKTMFSFVK